MSDAFEETRAEFEQAIALLASTRYVLRLYVAGQNPKSTASVAAIKSICERHLAGRYDLEVVDIYQQPELTAEEEIVLAPTLVKRMPLPLRRLVGDFSAHDRVLVALDIRASALGGGQRP